MSEYSTLAKEHAFTVTITANCSPTLTHPSSATTLSYLINSSGVAAAEATIPAFPQGDCTYTETLSFTPDLTGAGYDWITYTGASRKVSISSTSDTVVPGSYSFRVVSTLSVVGTVSTSTDASNYPVSVTLLSCFKETVFVEPTMADPFITVTDFLDASATFSDAGDSTGGSLCGTRTYALTDSAGSAVTWASVDPATRTVTVQPRGTGIGTQTLKLVITSE